MIFVMAGVPNLRFPSLGEAADSTVVEDSVPEDTIVPRAAKDSLSKDSTSKDGMQVDTVLADTLGMDSLQLLIWKRNKAIDDSLYADSLNRQRKNGIDAPVTYSADD